MIEKQSKTLILDTSEYEFPKDLNNNSALLPKLVSKVDKDTNLNQVNTKSKNDDKSD